MMEIRKLTGMTFEEYQSLGHDGYSTNTIYQIITDDKDGEISFTLKFRELNEPFVKTYPVNNDSILNYNDLISEGLSLSAFDDNVLTGVLVACRREWNNSIWIEFIEVAEAYRNKGIGTQLLTKLYNNLKGSGFRIIELETQNTNMPAIKFYRKNGFNITGLNTKLYDFPGNNEETALYMSKDL
ncbi:MAG: GNAT family N-acetyltransferase [Ignavibacteria bacterium]|nr:GNAT family N-acetyltransferase [Ignavibacteria bacterium]